MCMVENEGVPLRRNWLILRQPDCIKNERIITTPQRADIKVNDGEDVLNFVPTII